VKKNNPPVSGIIAHHPRTNRDRVKRRMPFSPIRPIPCPCALVEEDHILVGGVESGADEYSGFSRWADLRVQLDPSSAVPSPSVIKAHARPGTHWDLASKQHHNLASRVIHHCFPHIGSIPCWRRDRRVLADPVLSVPEPCVIQRNVPRSAPFRHPAKQHVRPDRLVIDETGANAARGHVLGMALLPA
jgi:hypothetical protein